MIWKYKPELEFANEIGKTCMVGHLDIVITEIGDDYIKATMPVDHRTKQPMGLLHGGASAVLSESLGSFASNFVVGDPFKYRVVGVEINANHLRSAKSGKVTGVCRPVKIGRSIHVWNTDIYDEEEKLICSSRLTVMVSEITTK